MGHPSATGGNSEGEIRGQTEKFGDRRNVPNCWVESQPMNVAQLFHIRRMKPVTREPPTQARTGLEWDTRRDRLSAGFDLGCDQAYVIDTRAVRFVNHCRHILPGDIVVSFDK
jgi:hypothetical protein